ncbi:unnamed protein product [Urochloa decumbens]|uniref:Uncharacterized protein n=1 Tax=Urochloa decumbens TaxID=240449 RepID=A0ABC9BRC8_9POAL
MGPSLSPSSVAADEHRRPCSPDDDEDYFEFTPLLLRPARRRRSTRTERPRTVHAAAAQPPQQRARRGTPTTVAAVAAPTPASSRKVRWHDMAFGSVRVPAAMDMGEIRRRLHARRQVVAGNEPSSAAGWAPWRLIRSLSCKGVEAVAAAAAPVRLV